jgi:hypothetical protein
MDCKTARLLLDFQRPRAGELPADDAAALEGHLAGCPDCDAICRTERRLDDYFGRAVRDVPLPDGLRERLLGRLQEERSAAVRRQLAWAARGLAVAAALLIGMFVWWHFVGSQPKPLDFQAALEEDFTKANARASAEQVQDWFRDQHQVTMVAPKQFNYAWLADIYLTTLQGKRVPKLVFQLPVGAQAHVFVLGDDQFDLGRLRTELANTPAEPSKLPELVSLDRRLTLLESDEPHGPAYLVIYEGDRLESFCLNGEIH